MTEYAIQYWNRVDKLRGKTPLYVIADEIQVPLQTLKNLRSQHRYPKSESSALLAAYLGTTVDFLMTGGENISVREEEYCPEAKFVQDTPEIRTIVRLLMSNKPFIAYINALIADVERNCRDSESVNAKQETP